MQTLIEKIQSLPPDAQQQVEEYVDFLLSRHVRHAARKLSRTGRMGWHVTHTNLLLWNSRRRLWSGGTRFVKLSMRTSINELV